MQTTRSLDIWAQWILHRRHGSDPQRLQAMLAHLYPIRDRVLSQARCDDASVLLDIGCGDGLIAFGALEKSASCRVIFSDISQDLLDHAARLAVQMRLDGRCTFVRASADDLHEIADASVDAVTTRSVLIYVLAKQRAFEEFHRVLRPKGRLSIFEPINRFGEPQPDHMFWGFDVTPVAPIAAKLKDFYRRLLPLDSNPMMNFDERDLIAWAEAAGFRDVHLELQVTITPLSSQPDMPASWTTYLRSAANPKCPTFEEAMAQVLTPAERATFEAHLRPRVEAKEGTFRSAVAYLWATK
ncbi:MAG: class I SAM-dependent methyltransferase [Acidobacteria bacterium]|nr:class I SAM-dependent methyltransferase [Acidobacteriota bacterium]